MLNFNISKKKKKKTKKVSCMTFLCMLALRNKTVADTFLQSLDSANGRLCQEQLLLRSKTFAAMVT